MAANLAEILISGRTFPNVLALPKSAKIGDLDVETNIEETHSDSLEITEHPIEQGAAITDHSYKRPPELIMRCGWSNASIKALLGIISGFFTGGTMAKADYVSGIYSQLLKMQESREPLTVISSLRQYDNMLIRNLTATRDQRTSQILSIQATFRGVILVSTQSATLAPKEDQATPQSTAETEQSGVKQVTPGFPSPGGTVPPNDWGG